MPKRVYLDVFDTSCCQSSDLIVENDDNVPEKYRQMVPGKASCPFCGKIWRIERPTGRPFDIKFSPKEIKKMQMSFKDWAQEEYGAKS